MKIQLNSEQQKLLEMHGIAVNPDAEYSEDEAFELLDRVHDIEAEYAQEADAKPTDRKLANEYASIADAIQNQIPED